MASTAKSMPSRSFRNAKVTALAGGLPVVPASPNRRSEKDHGVAFEHRAVRQHDGGVFRPSTISEKYPVRRTTGRPLRERAARMPQ